MSPVESCDDSDPCTLDECAPELGCTHTPVEGCGEPEPSPCTTYRFAWTDGFDVPQSGTFDVEGGEIVGLNFEYALLQPDACEDLSSPWCHFPGSEWTIESSDFTALEPNGFHMVAKSEHDTEFRFYYEGWGQEPAIYLYKPVGSQNTTAFDPDITWTLIGPCEGDPCADKTCDDDDPCTSDTCVEGVCEHSADPSAEGCEDTNACSEEVKVNCGGSCCCFEKSHTLDLGAQVSPDTQVNCCIRPGLNCGCTGDAVYEVSSDGIVWEVANVFETTSDKVGGVCPNSSAAWVDHCQPVTANAGYRYVRGTHDDCYADFFECTVEGSDCEDDNP